MLSVQLDNVICQVKNIDYYRHVLNMFSIKPTIIYLAYHILIWEVHMHG